MTDPLHSNPQDRADWADLDSVAQHASHFFDRFTADGYAGLRAAIEGLGGRPQLHGLCERLPFMDKLVIWQEKELDVRLRVHVFRPGYDDYPHNHRFAFASRILAGRYVHRTYAPEILQSGATRPWPMLTLREETEGSQYAMHPDEVHAVSADQTTVTLMLRGPIVRATATILRDGGRMTLHSASVPAPVPGRSRVMEDGERSAVCAEVAAILSDGRQR
jgi:hypothetical protein